MAKKEEKTLIIEEIISATGMAKEDLDHKTDEDLKLIKNALEGQSKKNLESATLKDSIIKDSELTRTDLKNKTLPQLQAMKQVLDKRKPSKARLPAIIMIMSLVALIFSINTIVFLWSTLDLVLGFVLSVIAILSSLMLAFSAWSYLQHPNVQSSVFKDSRKPQNENSKASTEGNESGSWITNSLTLLVGVLMMSALAIIALMFAPQAYGLPLSVVFGVIFLLVALTSASMIFKHLKMDCNDEALGLPRGSIRALIALSLIIIFAIMAIFMYSGLGPQPYFVDYNMTVAYPNGTINLNQNGTVFVPEVTQAQKDFSMQTLTTVGTLVVAIAAFYFGSRSVETASNVLKEGKVPVTPELIVEPESPKRIKKGEPLRIRVTTNPIGELIKPTVDGDNLEQLKASEEFTGEYIYTPTAGKETVVLNFALASNTNVKKPLTVIIEKPSGEAQKAEVKSEAQKAEVK